MARRQAILALAMGLAVVGSDWADAHAISGWEIAEIAVEDVLVTSTLVAIGTVGKDQGTIVRDRYGQKMIYCKHEFAIEEVLSGKTPGGESRAPFATTIFDEWGRWLPGEGDHFFVAQTTGAVGVGAGERIVAFLACFSNGWEFAHRYAGKYKIVKGAHGEDVVYVPTRRFDLIREIIPDLRGYDQVREGEVVPVVLNLEQLRAFIAALKTTPARLGSRS